VLLTRPAALTAAILISSAKPAMGGAFQTIRSRIVGPPVPPRARIDVELASTTRFTTVTLAWPAFRCTACAGASWPLGYDSLGRTVQGVSKGRRVVLETSVE